MSGSKTERISALLDDELPPREAQRLLDVMRDDHELQECWGRYRIIGEALRGERIQVGCRDSVISAVRRQLSDEPTVLAPRTRSYASKWLKPTAAIAVAASVAMLAVVTTLSFRGGESAVTGDLLARGSDAEAVAVPTQAPPRKSGWVEASPEVQEKLNRYLATHSEYAARGSVRGMVPYATLVGYDGDR